MFFAIVNALYKKTVLCIVSGRLSALDGPCFEAMVEVMVEAMLEAMVENELRKQIGDKGET